MARSTWSRCFGSAVSKVNFALQIRSLLVFSAADFYVPAVGQAPSCLPLLVEATEQLLAAGRPAACSALIAAAPERVARHGRVLLQQARALLADGQVDAARALLEAGIEVPDLREGETLGAIWQAAFGDRPLPPSYDFRMQSATG